MINQSNPITPTEKKNTIISINTEASFNKIQYLFMIKKTLGKLGIEWELPQSIKGHVDK